MLINIYFSIRFIKPSKLTSNFSKEIINNIKSNNIIKRSYIRKKLIKLLINNFITNHQDIYKHNLINLEKILKYKIIFTIKIRYKYIHQNKFPLLSKN